MRRISKYFFFLTFLAAAGCGTDDERVNDDRQYLPLRKGLYQLYDVAATHYSVAEDPLVLHYQLKTVVVDSFLNTPGNFTYVIYRYTRDDESAAWQYLDTWSARVDAVRAVVAEGNTDFVKLAFPLSTGRSWDGNGFNGQEEDEYEVVTTGAAQTVGALSFDDCIEVSQNYLDDDIVKTDIRSEVYARGVGLVRREETVLNFCTVAGCPLGTIEYGVEYVQTIIAYGIE